MPEVLNLGWIHPLGVSGGGSRKKFLNATCSWNNSERNFAGKTGPEIVHASGTERQKFKERGLSLIWPTVSNKHVATGELRPIRTVAGEQAPRVENHCLCLLKWTRSEYENLGVNKIMQSLVSPLGCLTNFSGLFLVIIQSRFIDN